MIKYLLAVQANLPLSTYSKWYKTLSLWIDDISLQFSHTHTHIYIHIYIYIYIYTYILYTTYIYNQYTNDRFECVVNSTIIVRFRGGSCSFFHGPPAKYVKLRVVHAPGMPGTFSPPQQIINPDMHHGTCVTHVPWCISVANLYCALKSVAGKTFPAHAQPAILRICKRHIASCLIWQGQGAVLMVKRMASCPWQLISVPFGVHHIGSPVSRSRY